VKFKEVLEKIGVEEDEKSRRVRNVSRATARITAAEIESGVTLERLSDIGVPVFKYSTQVTIHGRVPDFDPASRPGGYKSIFANANGTLGVRYVAIDSAKKTQIVDAARLAVDRKWTTNYNSTGLEISGYFEERDACITAFRSFPRELFAGSMFAAAGMLGGYYVVASVGAIPAENLWPLINALWQVRDEAHYNELEAAKTAEYEARRAADARAAEERAAKRAETLRSFLATATQRRLSALPSGEGQFLKAGFKLSGEAVFFLYTVKKRGPRLCYVTKVFDGTTEIPAGRKMTALDGRKVQSLVQAARDGMLFELAAAV
jgi:hypothetical protein